MDILLYICTIKLNIKYQKQEENAEKTDVYK